MKGQKLGHRFASQNIGYIICDTLNVKFPAHFQQAFQAFIFVY